MHLQNRVFLFMGLAVPLLLGLSAQADPAATRELLQKKLDG